MIRSASKYDNGKGKSGQYSYDAATAKISFQSGPWEGYFGKLLGPDKIGLASRDNGHYGTSCNLK